MEVKTTAAKPAAGPLTLVCDQLMDPTTIPPKIPEMTPDIKGAPEAKAIPRHKGNATKKTTKPAIRSLVIYLKFIKINSRRCKNTKKMIFEIYFKKNY